MITTISWSFWTESESDGDGDNKDAQDNDDDDDKDDKDKDDDENTLQKWIRWWQRGKQVGQALCSFPSVCKQLPDMITMTIRMPMIIRMTIVVMMTK